MPSGDDVEGFLLLVVGGKMVSKCGETKVLGTYLEAHGELSEVFAQVQRNVLERGKERSCVEGKRL